MPFSVLNADSTITKFNLLENLAILEYKYCLGQLTKKILIENSSNQNTLLSISKKSTLKFLLTGRQKSIQLRGIFGEHTTSLNFIKH